MLYLGLPFWYGAIGLIVLTGIFTVFGGMKGSDDALERYRHLYLL
jgi:hypothetical protein